MLALYLLLLTPPVPQTGCVDVPPLKPVEYCTGKWRLECQCTPKECHYVYVCVTE